MELSTPREEDATRPVALVRISTQNTGSPSVTSSNPEETPIVVSEDSPALDVAPEVPVSEPSEPPEEPPPGMERRSGWDVHPLRLSSRASSFSILSYWSSRTLIFVSIKFGIPFAAPATPSPPPRPLVSSLDKAQLLMAEARKLRKRRRKAAAAAAGAATAGGKGPNSAGTKAPAVTANNVDTEDDEEEEEGEAVREELEELMKELEELDEWRRARCSITTVWPKKYDESDDVEVDEDKMRYITALGLRTKR